MQEDTQIVDPSKLLAEFKDMRLLSAKTDNDKNSEDTARIPHTDFVTSESRYENSLKFLPIWLEAFVITSMALTFGPIMKEEGRKQVWIGF